MLVIIYTFTLLLSIYSCVCCFLSWISTTFLVCFSVMRTSLEQTVRHCLETAFTPLYSQLGFIHHCPLFITVSGNSCAMHVSFMKYSVEKHYINMFEIVLHLPKLQNKKKQNENSMKCFIGHSSKVPHRPMSAFLSKIGAACTNETPFVM